MDWSTILVPLDGSPLSEAALPYAETIAAATGASLQLLSIVEWEPRLPVSRLDSSLSEVERLAAEAEQAEQQARARYLADREAELQEQGLTVSSTVVLGDPVDVILEAASQDDVTMVVMATRGRGAVGRLLIGSVADSLVRTVPRPTLLVRPTYVRVPPHRARLEQLAVALDGSPEAETVLPLAGQLESAAGATLYLVRVEPAPAGLGEPSAALPQPSRPEEDATAEARAYLVQATDQLPPGLSVEPVVLLGSPAQSLEEFVVHERIDLLVMTTRGRGGLRRLLLGNTAEALVRSGVPTLLLRTTAAADEPAASPPAPMVTVGEIMNRPLVTAPEDATLAEIAQLMLERGIGCLPLVDARGKLSGVISEADLTGSAHYNRLAGDRIPYLFGRPVTREELESSYQAGRTITAREIVSGQIVTATEDELVVDVVQRMLRSERSCLPVVRAGVLIGMVTRHDLLKLIVRDATGP